jgi:hypothetical protein
LLPLLLLLLSNALQGLQAHQPKRTACGLVRQSRAQKACLYFCEPVKDQKPSL